MKSRVIPTFFAITPERNITLPSSNRNLHVHARREIELHQRVHGLRGGVDNIEKPLVSADLELVTGFLVHVGTTQNGVFLDLVRQGDRPAHLRAGPLGSIDDFLRAGIQHAVIERLEPNANVLALHWLSLSRLWS